MLDWCKMKKYRKSKPKPLPKLDSYEEAIIIMMRYGNSIETIARSLKVPEKHLINYLNDKGIINKMKGRSWTYKGRPKRKNHSVDRERIIK